jgi:hypothetical protein
LDLAGFISVLEYRKILPQKNALQNPASKNFDWTFIFLCINFLFIYIYIFGLLLNYDIPWMVYEKLKTHMWILENGKEWHFSDFAKALNTKIIEIDPNRISRPLSNLVEVIDTKFRANLWDYIPPHPTLSLQWPFLFIGLPLLLYKFFRNVDCSPLVAFVGTSLYLTSSGFLSPIVQMSHPAKNMVNFFFILTLATLTQLYRTAKPKNVSIKDVPHFWPILISSLLWTITAFFSDETGLFLFVILGFIGLPLVLKFKERAVFLLSWAILPVIYIMVVRMFLPWLHSSINHETIELNHYRDFPHISSLFLPNLHNLFINAYLLLSVHPCLRWNFAPLAGHPFLIFLQCIYTLAFLFLIGSAIRIFLNKQELTSRKKQILASLAMIVIFTFFQTFQLSHNVQVWTVFWYGCLFSMVYYVALTFVLQLVWEEYKGKVFRSIFPWLILIFTVHGLVSSTYIFTMFKNQSEDSADFHYPDIFSGRVTPYPYFDLSKSFQKSRCRYVCTLLYWSKIKNKSIDPRPFARDFQFCPGFEAADPHFQVDQLYYIIEAAFEFPQGHSYLNDMDFVSRVVHQAGEPP